MGNESMVPAAKLLTNDEEGNAEGSHSPIVQGTKPGEQDCVADAQRSEGEKNGSETILDEERKMFVGEDEGLVVQDHTNDASLLLTQPAVEAMPSVVEVKGPAQISTDDTHLSLKNSVTGMVPEEFPDNGLPLDSSQAHYDSKHSLRSADLAGIGLLEKNLIELINDNGGFLDVKSWADAYRERFGRKAFKHHMEAAGCVKMKDMLPRLETVKRGNGPKGSFYLFNLQKTDQDASGIAHSGVDPLVELENKLLLIIQGRKGNAKMKNLRSDFGNEYGPRALELALKDSGFGSLELAMKHMTRISPLRKSNKTVYVITHPRKSINLPQTNNVQPSLSQDDPSPNVQVTSVQDERHYAASFVLIDSHEKLQYWNESFLQQFLQNRSEQSGSNTPEAMAFSCHGGSDSLYLVSLAFTPSDAFVFDCMEIGSKSLCETLRPLFESSIVTKLIHDLHQDVVALRTFGCLDFFRGMMDTQLVVEYMHTSFHCDFFEMMDCLQLEVPASMRVKKRIAPRGGAAYSKRPVSVELVSSVVDRLKLLVQSFAKIRSNFDSKTWEALGKASDIRANSSVATSTEPSRRVAFDVSCGYRIVSYELLTATHPENMMVEQPLEVVQDISTLLGILPLDVQEAMSGLDTTHLADIVFDKGRRPHAWINGKREMLFASDRLVEAKEIEDIAERFRFGSDNRAGLERQLHRISAIRNRESAIIGMTVRVGRHVSGNAGIIADLLFHCTGSSILFLGEPGSGKTTIVREVTRILAEQTNVCIVDTSNEIAGDGDIPHPCVGFARRLMVPTLDKQSAVMIEAVQNHTPTVMVIDEIGRKTEVEAAQTCKNRGVRLIASAHGDLRKLVKNQKIRGVVGGVESVTLGDIEAKREGKKFGEEMSKVKTQRAGAPIFEIVIELERGSYDSWRVVMDSGKAVDSILERQHYESQRRTREPETGAIHLSFESA